MDASLRDGVRLLAGRLREGCESADLLLPKSVVVEVEALVFLCLFWERRFRLQDVLNSEVYRTLIIRLVLTHK